MRKQARGRFRPNRNLPNPMVPSSPGFAERNAKTAADVGLGIVRVDSGQPAGLVRDLTS